MRIGIGIPGGSRKSGPFTPAQLSGLVFWVQPQKSATVTLNGSTVSALADQSGLGNGVSQATGAKQFTYATGVQNGLAMLQGGGSASPRTLTGTIPQLANPAGFSVFYVARTGASVPQYQICVASGAGATAGTRWGFGLGSDTSATHQGYGWGGPSANVNLGNGNFAVNTTYLIDAVSNLTAWTVSKNGVSQSTPADTSKPTATWQNVLGSESASSTLALLGYLGEVLIFNRALSAGEQAQVRSYLNSAWAIY